MSSTGSSRSYSGHVPLPGIGIAAATETAAAQAGIGGVIIIKVLPRSPAAQAELKGMTSNGTIEDVITAVNGQKVHGISDLGSMFEELGVGQSATLTIVWGDETRTVQITLADMAARTDEVSANP